MFGQPRRGGLAPAGCPHWSTVLRATVIESAEPSDRGGVSLGIARRRVSWVCRQVVRPADCRGGSRSEPPTWSRDTAAKKVIFASLDATWVCQAGGGLTFPPIFQARRRRVRWPSGGGRVPSNRSRKNSLRAAGKKSRRVAEPVDDERVEWMA